jgi:hypothetical protein
MPLRAEKTGFLSARRGEPQATLPGGGAKATETI